jgi:hypothetical protein
MHASLTFLGIDIQHSYPLESVKRFKHATFTLWRSLRVPVQAQGNIEDWLLALEALRGTTPFPPEGGFGRPVMISTFPEVQREN